MFLVWFCHIAQQLLWSLEIISEQKVEMSFQPWTKSPARLLFQNGLAVSVRGL